MRIFLLLLALAWLAGIISGTAAHSVLIVFAGALVAGAALALVPASWPLRVCQLGLFGLGWVLGSTVSAAPVPECTAASPAHGVVSAVHRVQAQRVQYMVDLSPGCTILVTANRFPEYQIGNTLALRGSAQSLSALAPEYAGYAQYLARRGVFAVMRYGNIELMDGRTAWRGSAASSLRAHIDSLIKEPEASLVKAMLMAERGLLSARVEDAFRRTGVSHILAVSGLHIGLLAGLAVAVLLLVPLSPAWRAAGAVALLGAYIIFIGAPISAVRAGFFWTAALLAWQLRALISLPTIIVLTAVGLVTAHPAIVQEVSFQLSFAAVAGIGLALLLGKGLLRSAPDRWAQNALLVAAGAAAGTWPLVSYHFGSIPLLTVPANILVVPAVPLFLAVSLLVLAAGALWPPLAGAGSFVLHVLWEWMTQVTFALASIPHAYLEDARLPLAAVVFYYLALSAAVVVFTSYRGLSWREVWQ